MPYLIPQDYLMSMQPQLRAQINSLAMARAELTAIEEINGYISKKYDTATELTDTMLYSTSARYKAANRVYVNYPAYSASATYSVGNNVIQGNNAYTCNTAITVAEAFNASKWTQIAGSTAIYYAAYPYPKFNIYGSYAVGDKVWWDNRTYTCKQSTKGLSAFQQLQYPDFNSIPLNNVFPSDPVNGSAYWTDNGAYSIAVDSLNSPAYDSDVVYTIGDLATFESNVYYCIVNMEGAEVFNPDHWRIYWIIGDNRSQLMVTHVCNVALYWALYSITPNNIPDDRRDAYGIAKEWCKGVMRGDISTALPPIQPKKGQRILFNSEVKREYN